MPEKPVISNTGEFKFGFSNLIDAKNVTALLQSLPKVPEKEEKANRMLRALNTETESDGNGVLIVDISISDLLRNSKSIITELVPGTENNLDKKKYEWKVVEYESKKVRIAFTFENPEFISVEEFDTMKVTFNNTESWLEPLDLSKYATPNGFVQVLKIPPQGVGLMSTLEI